MVYINIETKLNLRNAIFWDVTLGRNNVSEEYIGSIIRVKRISEQGTLAVTIRRY
jgi:hypothetical protein